MWSEADAELYSSWPLAERDGRVLATAWHRVADDILAYLLFVPDKFRLLMADNEYAQYWSVSFVEPSHWLQPPQAKPVADFVAGPLAQAFLTALLFMTLLACVPRVSHISAQVATVAVLALLLGHVVLEVQPRYHHELMLSWSFPPGLRPLP